MIDVFLDGHQLCVALDPSHHYYDRARIVVRSLLSSFEYANNKFRVDYDDLGFMRHKLDMLGLVEDRTITEDAVKWVDWLHSKQVKNEDLKAGRHNEFIKQLLAGKLRTTLYEDQVSAVAYLVSNKRAGLFDTMGTGKSVEALAATAALGYEAQKTLVVCPHSVMIGFAREVQKHTYLKSISVPTGRKKALEFVKASNGGDWDLMFTHPENLIKANRERKSEYAGDLTKFLMRMTWDQVVVDEFHMYKNWGAKRTRCVVDIINQSRGHDGKSPRLILMTGTPVSENPTSAYVVLKLLGGGMPHASIFENYFCVKKTIKMGKKGTSKKKGNYEEIKFKKIVGFKNLDELKTRIERVSIRRTKNDLTGFPDQIPVVRDIVLSGRQYDLYREACGEVRRSISSSDRIKLHALMNSAKTLRLRQLMNHPALLGEGGDSAKYKELDYILEELLADEEQKVVIWTEWRAAVEMLHDRYKDLYGAEKVYGGVGNEELDYIREKFENEVKPKIIVSIPAKGGTGLDFLARARTAIYVDRPRSFILYNQSLDRVCRRIPPEGPMSRLDRIRAQPSTLVFLDVVGSLDEMIRDEIWGKMSFVDAVTIKDEKLIELGRSDLLKYLR